MEKEVYNMKNLKPMMYIFYGSSGIGKTTIANVIGRDKKNFRLVNERTMTLEYLKELISSGFCVVHDGSRKRINAEALARRISNIGISCVLVEFKVFA